MLTTKSPGALEITEMHQIPLPVSTGMGSSRGVKKIKSMSEKGLESSLQEEGEGRRRKIE